MSANPIPDPFHDPHTLGYGRPLKALVYGPPGAGKTLLALQSMPEPIAVIDLEAGTNWYPDVSEHRVMRTTTLADIKQALRFLYKDNGATYKTVVIDPLTVLWDVIKDGYFEAQDKIREIGAGKIPFNAWSKIKPQMYQIYDILLNLPIHVILTARAKDDLDVSGDGKSIENRGLKPDVEKSLGSILDMQILLYVDGNVRKAKIEKDRTGFLGREGAVITNLSRKHFEPIFEAISHGPTAATPSISAGVDSLIESAVSDATTPANQSKVVQHPSAPKPITKDQKATIYSWSDQLGGNAWDNGAGKLRFGEFSTMMRAKTKGEFKPIATSDELNYDTAPEFIKYLGTIAEQYFLFHNTGKETFADGWEEVGGTIAKQVAADGRTTAQFTYTELKKANELLTTKIADFEAANEEPAEAKYVVHKSPLWYKFMEAGEKAFGSKAAWDKERHAFIVTIHGDEDRASSTKMTVQEMGEGIAALGKMNADTATPDKATETITPDVEWSDLELYHRILLRKLAEDGPQHYSKLRLFGKGFDEDLKSLGLIEKAEKSGYSAISEAGKAVLLTLKDEGKFQTVETYWDGMHILVFDPETGTKVGIRTNTLIDKVKTIAAPGAYVDGESFSVHFISKSIEVSYRKEKAGHFVAYDITVVKSDEAKQEPLF